MSVHLIQKIEAKSICIQILKDFRSFFHYFCLMSCVKSVLLKFTGYLLFYHLIPDKVLFVSAFCLKTVLSLNQAHRFWFLCWTKTKIKKYICYGNVLRTFWEPKTNIPWLFSAGLILYHSKTVLHFKCALSV